MIGGDGMDDIELRLKFLEGKPIKMKNNISVHKVSFSDVNDIGYIKYHRIIDLLCMDKSRVEATMKEDMSVYNFFLLLILYVSENEKDNNNQTLMDNLLEVFRYIFADYVIYDSQSASFHIGKNGYLNESNFTEFQNIIKLRNCLENIEEEKENPANEMARMLLEKRRKAREKVAQIKAKQNGSNGEPLTLDDLISIYAEAEHIYVEDVFKYDIYQFNKQFNRMKIFKDYEVNVQALLAGAKSEDLDFQHWLSKIKTK